KHRLVETVIPGERELDADALLVGRSPQADRRREHRRFCAIEPLNERDQPAVVAHLHDLRRRVALVAELDREAGIEESELAKPPLEQREIEIGLGEGYGARFERDLSAARMIARPDNAERRLGLAVAEADQMLLA